MAFLIGKKIGMTQVYDDNGNVQPVTLIDAKDATITQVLTTDKNPYNAVQVGVGERNLNKPEQGHLKDFVNKNGKGFAFLTEFKIGEGQEFKRGDKLGVDQFELGQRIVVKGVTKGKGFQGVVKKWGFHGGPKTHGTKKTHRAPGSIGSAFPQHVLKGLKMAGRMGGVQKSVVNLKVAYIDKENNILGVRGPVPGNPGGYVEVTSRN